MRTSRHLLAVSLASFLFFAAFSRVHGSWPSLTALDLRCYEGTLLLSQGPLVPIARMVSVLGGSPWIFSMAGAIAILLAIKKHARLALWFALSIVTGMALNAALKNFWERSRPLIPDPDLNLTTFAYPSGHAFGALVFYGLTLHVAGSIIPSFAKPLWWGLTSAVIAGIGISRVLLGVHWATDVLGGYLWGLGWMFLCLWIASAFVSPCKK